MGIVCPVVSASVIRVCAAAVARVFATSMRSGQFFLDIGFRRLHSQRLRRREFPDTRPAKTAQVAAATQDGPEIIGQATYIGTR